MDFGGVANYFLSLFCIKKNFEGGDVLCVTATILSA